MTRSSTGPSPSSPPTTALLIDPARALKPRDKARVERPVPYARDSFFAGRADEFASEVHMQTDAVRWCRDVANVGRCRGPRRRGPSGPVRRPKRATCCWPLPAHALRAGVVDTVKVQPDIHVKVGKALYSMPWRYIGKVVDAQQGTRTVEFFLDGTLVKTHVRIEKGKQTDYNDYPPEKIAFLHAQPGLVPPPGRRDRAVGRRAGRGPHGGQRPLSPAQRPRGGPPGRQIRRRAHQRGVSPGPPGR